jgi:long-subunit acyl-CoA synthetase (AMP-forming)
MQGTTHLFFAESLDTFLQDLQRTRPTLFLSVPRLWLKFQQGVFAKMPPAKLDRLLGIPILGKIVAKKVRKGLGLDQVRLAGSGSAPIPPGLITWYRRIGLPLYEGYGMTEDSSYSHASTEGSNAPGSSGADARRGVKRRGRGADQVTGPVQRLLQAVGAHRRVVHRGWLLPHRRPG